MFFVKDSWLQYEPFQHYRLPEIVFKPHYHEHGAENPGMANFVNKDTGKLAFRRSMYRLRWPGERDRGHDDRIPTRIIQHWPNALSRQFQDIIERADKGAFEPVTLVHLLEQQMLPPDDQIPEAIAYHLAVNHKLYFPDVGVQFPVAGLPARRVQQVLDATFALDDKTLAALRYLKWMAEGHHEHPLLQDFGTAVQGTLGILGQTAAELFFYLIFDCQYDTKTQWWARNDGGLAYQIPLYLHWVGRTGMGMYSHMATIPPPARHCSDPPWDERYPDVLDQLKRWDMDKMRRFMHIEGKVPEAKGDHPRVQFPESSR